MQVHPCFTHNVRTTCTCRLYSTHAISAVTPAAAPGELPWHPGHCHWLRCTRRPKGFQSRHHQARACRPLMMPMQGGCVQRSTIRCVYGGGDWVVCTGCKQPACHDTGWSAVHAYGKPCRHISQAIVAGRCMHIPSAESQEK